MIRLRPATPADQALLERWDEAPHVRANAGDDGGFDWKAELPRSPPWRAFLIALESDRPIGFIQIIDPELEESHYWGAIGPAIAPSTSGSAKRTPSARGTARR
jgi:aminoglycoside 6'-N-acetyltransferase